jgi:glycosyltransferase involved in cell wall biosynthesis
MKISVITVCYNSAEHLGDAITSVAEQNYLDKEHIVVDGGSNDGTLEVIRSNDSKIARWISEQDEGIYDAMNKGIGMATGDVIGILNSDDFYFSNSILSKVARAF